MPVIIDTGDPKKCRQINLLECPACSVAFELTTGKYLSSSLLDSSVLVCQAHQALTVKDELAIQEAMQRALAHPRGSVQRGCQLLKRSKILEDLNYQTVKDW